MKDLIPLEEGEAEKLGLEVEGDQIIALPEPEVDPEREEFVRLCGPEGKDVDLGPCPVCGLADCEVSHLED